MVLFLISNYDGFNTGRGGHYYSLQQMAEAISHNMDIIIIALGNDMPVALSDMDNTYHVLTELHLQYKGLKSVISKLKSLNVLHELIAVHAYDAKSVYIGAHIANTMNIPFVLTKCGGRTPKNFYPKVSSLIVFHEKDYNYFYNCKKHYQNLYLIPNRVKSVNYKKNRAYQIDNIRENNAFNIIKIGRIGNYYNKTLTDSIRLCSKIQEDNFPVKLTFIGYEESLNVTEKLIIFAQKLGVNLSVYSDSDHTTHASELIWACDAAIGTGRGAMEALSAGKILLFPVANFDYPCLFNEKTAPYAIQDNFSERVILPNDLGKYCDPNYIKSLLLDRPYKTYLEKFGFDTFNSNFNVDIGARKVIDIYHNSQNVKPISNWYLLVLHLHSMKIYFKHKSKPFRYRLKALVK